MSDIGAQQFNANNKKKNEKAVSITKRSQNKEIIIRFLRNKAAVLGLIIVVVLIFCMLFPTALTSYDPMIIVQMI
mgnify:FL=1